MSAVDNPKSMLENNLMVEVEKDSIGLNVTGYEIYLELDNPSIITSNANGFPQWLYFQCTNQRSPNLRNRYFDIHVAIFDDRVEFANPRRFSSRHLPGNLLQKAPVQAHQQTHQRSLLQERPDGSLGPRHP